ncbi:MAG: c-type cytochrome [Sphingobacteriaceae bacterium]
MEEVLKRIRSYLIAVILLLALIVGLILTLVIIKLSPDPSLSISKQIKTEASVNQPKPPLPATVLWKAPNIDAVTDQKEKEVILYGKDLIANTSKYLGPNGTVAQISNGMNCQNCHLDAGTKFLGNNYSAVYVNYPKLRARSGTRETIIKRISDCFERSLNGTKPDSSSKEMTAMVAYMTFLGKDVKKGTTPKGVGLQKLAYLERAADTIRGKVVYQSKCLACHGSSGSGMLAADKKGFTFPPLWGPNSYNDGAGLYRISNFAGYVKNNMPLGATDQNQMLTDEEAWDVAAFVNSQSRPRKDQQSDWQDISKKPIDFPYGPYSDQFGETQHKFGPFQPITDARKDLKKINNQI